MRRRRLLILLLAGAGVAVVVFLAWPRQREPEYRGRTLSEWAFFYFRAASKDGHTSFEAESAFQHIGTNGLPWALKWIQYQPPPWKKKLVGITAKLPKPFRFEDRADELATGAWAYLITLGPRASPAIPELTR